MHAGHAPAQATGRRGVLDRQAAANTGGWFWRPNATRGRWSGSLDQFSGRGERSKERAQVVGCHGYPRLQWRRIAEWRGSGGAPRNYTIRSPAPGSTQVPALCGASDRRELHGELLRQAGELSGPAVARFALDERLPELGLSAKFVARVR